MGTEWSLRNGERQYRVGPSGLLIGRAHDVDIVLSGRDVSRLHATVRMDGEDLIGRDEGSAHGTKVNDLPLTAPHRLVHGDRITVGQHVLIVLDLTNGDRNLAPTKVLSGRDGRG